MPNAIDRRRFTTALADKRMNIEALRTSNPDLYRMAMRADSQRAGERGHGIIEGDEWGALYDAISAAETAARTDDDPDTVELDNPHLQQIQQLTQALLRSADPRTPVDGAIGVTTPLAQDTPGRPGFWRRFTDWLSRVFLGDDSTLTSNRAGYLEAKARDFGRTLGGAERREVEATLRDPTRREAFTQQMARIIKQSEGYDGDDAQARADAEAIVRGLMAELGIEASSPSDDGDDHGTQNDRGAGRSQTEATDGEPTPVPDRPADSDINTDNIIDLSEKDGAENTMLAMPGDGSSVSIGRNGEVVVTGTDEDDVITVDVDPESEPDEQGRRGVIVTVNGTSYRLSAEQAENLTIRGGKGNDQIWVAPEVMSPHVLDGGEGDDTLVGGNGRSIIVGGAGNDRIYGRGGRNQLSGGDGDDIIVGGEGKNYIRGGAGDDRIWGGANEDVIFGEEGDDEIEGRGGGDYLDGGDGDDTIRGGRGDDRIWGGAGDDDLFGDDGDDILVDNEGANRYDGGRGENDIHLPSSVRIETREGARTNVHVLEVGAPLPDGRIVPKDIPFEEE